MVQKALESIEEGAVGAALVVDEKDRLVGIVTDGDLRRAILRGVKMSDGVERLLEGRTSEYEEPTAAPVGTAGAELLLIMKDKGLRQIPLLDPEGRVVELALLEELVADQPLPLSAVVMAGGFGMRLRPLTDKLPKPMLPLNGRPVMEHTIDHLRKGGITQIYVTTHYKSEVIAEHFHDGRDFGVNIEYVNENQPLGTAGALGLIDKPEHTSLVINGDILTQLDFRAMLGFHKNHGSVLTVGMRKYDIQVPYGVVEMDGVNITGITEKPEYAYFINAGIYMLEPEIYDSIPDGGSIDMPDLIDRLLLDGKKIIGFPIQEYWLDIGKPDDYQRAMKDTEDGRW
jgi:dTDP-glucose pyrophosphorylase